MRLLIALLLAIVSFSASADHGKDWCRDSTFFVKNLFEFKVQGGERDFTHYMINTNQDGGLTKKYPTLSSEDMHEIVDWTYDSNLSSAKAQKKWSDACLKPA